MSSYTFNVEVKNGDDWREDTFEVDYDYEPFVPGQLSGPPENCYPNEGGYADAYGDVAWTKDGEKKSTKISFSVFLEIFAEARNLKNDPADKLCRKTALEQAEEQINQEISEACEENLCDAEDDANEDKYEREMDRLEDEADRGKNG